MILLQIYFDVSAEQCAAFERMYETIYAPALRRQQGYQRSTLLRLYPPRVSEEIEASPTEFNYQMELVFDSEENRRHWAASDDHSVAFPQAQALARAVAWRGFDIAGSDSMAV